MAELKAFEIIYKLSPKAAVSKESEIAFTAKPVKELVRCLNCSHYYPAYHRCKVWNHMVDIDGWCYKGEKNG